MDNGPFTPKKYIYYCVKVFKTLSLCRCRRTDLEALGSSLQQYRDGHSSLIKWIEETTERQENAQPGQTDSRVLSEQLAQQTVSNSGVLDVFWFAN